MSLTSYIVDKVFAKGNDKRDAGLTAPENIIRYDDILYGNDHKWNILDVYRPKEADTKLPVIVSVHGGGWVYGDKERYQYYCMDLASRGFAVINFTYRLAPKHRFPAQLEDVCLAFEWLKNSYERYAFDLNDVFATGDSAGAHLLTLYCDLLINADYASRFSFRIPDLLPEAIALNCGVFNTNIDKGIIKMLVKDLISHKKDLELIDPLRYMTSDFPEAYVMTAIEDTVKDDSTLLLNRLNELKVRNIYKLYDNERHDLGHVFHLNISDPDAILCNDEECSFFLTHVDE